jgi:hypothetical protein
LLGGHYLDIVDLHGIRESTFYTVIDRTLYALEVATKCEIHFPSNEQERRVVASGFAKKTGGIMKGCLSALDSLAVKIKEPHLSECENPSAYKNRKGFFAIVVQAMCDVNILFTFVSVNSQGSCHDSTAFQTSSFYTNINELVPKGYWIAANDAYKCTNQVFTPFPGHHSHGTPEDAFNLWHSGAQRINIEYYMYSLLDMCSCSCSCFLSFCSNSILSVPWDVGALLEFLCDGGVYCGGHWKVA